ncbi:Na(+)/drug antiporter [Oligella ureolytica]|uniref:MATE family efflux transporter n=1 Tax=Oligella ureolytica TaxID=90244 RepID=A0A378XHL4_9BURK|nr:MATE family efflux transporter [Oligella ureolytica]QPT39836.1 MATE family efflux transporter [Oligella ureolytica]SUA57715.1 Na(+)/drug antiporter [Oligella ureolytica]
MNIEYRKLIVVALPLVFIQLCQASLGLVDTLLAGQYHYIDLAAVGLGSAVWTSVFIFLVGMLYVLVPKFAELAQNNDKNESKQLYAVAIRAAVVLSIVGFLVVHLAAFLIGNFISDEGVAAISKNYLHCVAFAFPPLIFIAMLRYIGEGHKRLTLLMLISAMLLLLNFLLSLWFVFGGLGIPALGGIGCGIGTALSAYIVMFVLYAMIKRSLPEVVVTKSEWSDIRVSGAKVKGLLKDGLPIGLALVLQILALALIAFAAEGLGVKHIGAHQVMISIAMCLVMIPLAIGNASTIQLAQYVAAKNALAIRHVIASALLTLVMYCVVMVVLVTSSYAFIIRFFTSDVVILELALSSIYAFVLFLIFDSVQMMLSGILRGFQDFINPLIAVLLAYWLVIIPTLFLISRWWISIDSVATIWTVMAFGLFGTALFLLLVLNSKRKIICN